MQCPSPEKKQDSKLWYKGDITGTTNYTFSGVGLEYKNVIEYSCPEG